MDTKKTYSIKFGKDQIVTLEYDGTLKGEEIYSVKSFDFDFENHEKTTLIITAYVGKTHESDKNLARVLKIFSDSKNKQDESRIGKPIGDE